jgi:hypothetical protein
MAVSWSMIDADENQAKVHPAAASRSEAERYADGAVAALVVRRTETRSPC